jgi:crotonobetainyl-CoA:carnitine CoA-transferase CaiB-like acyl-CoA transferase
VRQLGLPFTFSDIEPVPPRAAGMPGSDSSAVLASLGFDEAELRKAGAFDPETRT